MHRDDTAAWDDDEEDGNRSSAWNRRMLLGAVAGGFALTASGLLLPERLVDAAKLDHHPVRRIQKRQDQRREKRRNRLERRRHHQQRKQNGRPPGFGTYNMAIFVHNYRSVPVQVQGWQAHATTRSDDIWYKRGNDWDWSTIPAIGADGSHSHKEFVGDEKALAVQIGTDRVVSGWNFLLAPPSAEILTGGWSSKHGADRDAERLASSEQFWQGDTISAPGIKITRVDDLDKHLLYSVDLT
jgi:hypothetical protein